MDLHTAAPAQAVSHRRLIGKLLIGGFEARAKPWGADGIPDNFEFDELPFDMELSRQSNSCRTWWIRLFKKCIFKSQ